MELHLLKSTGTLPHINLLDGWQVI